MARLSRGKPIDAIPSDEGSGDEVSAMKSTRKRSAPSSRSSKSRGVSEVEDDDEGLPAAKKKAVADRASGRMFMVSVEGLSIYPSSLGMRYPSDGLIFG